MTARGRSQLDMQSQSVLKQIDGEVREFARSMEAVKKLETVEEKRTRGEELQESHDNLKKHRAQIMKWTQTSGKAASKEASDARNRIEQGMQTFREFQKDMAAEKANIEKIASEVTVTMVVVASEVKVGVEQLVKDESVDMQMVEEFVCKICLTHVVGCTPQMTCCSHLFCGDCLAQWFAMHAGNQSWAQRAQSKGSVPCPVCKEPLSDNVLHAVRAEGEGGSALLWQMLCDTKIMCASHHDCNPEGRCNWVGTYGTYQHHVRECTNEAGMPEASPSITENHSVDALGEPEVVDGGCAKERKLSSSSHFSRSTTADSETEGSAHSDEASSSCQNSPVLQAGESPHLEDIPEQLHGGEDLDIESEPIATHPDVCQAAHLATQDVSLTSLIGALVELKMNAMETHDDVASLPLAQTSGILLNAETHSDSYALNALDDLDEIPKSENIVAAMPLETGSTSSIAWQQQLKHQRQQWQQQQPQQSQPKQQASVTGATKTVQTGMAEQDCQWTAAQWTHWQAMQMAQWQQAQVAQASWSQNAHWQAAHWHSAEMAHMAQWHASPETDQCCFGLNASAVAWERLYSEDNADA